jgi:hypothetical protein
MALVISGLFMLAFVANVVLGAYTAQALFGDVGEMLLLLGASVAFVAAILTREAAEKKDD